MTKRPAQILQINSFRLDSRSKMKKIDLGQAVTILANFGVLIGILLLVFELNQNRVVTEAQTRSAITARIIELTEMITQSAVGMTIYEKRLNKEPLTVKETYWQRGASRAVFRHWENVYFQYLAGLFSEDELNTYRVFWRNVTRCRTWEQDFWANNKMQFNPKFREEMDSILGQSGECRSLTL
jgi:hypothetical protein